ncbi:MAG: cation diffusion facilitator family transporter [bacterium]|nr:cation diffusion facilitator family transporter [bacterium]
MQKKVKESMNREDYAIKVTWTGFFANLTLTMLKLAAGIFGRSGAMVADAVHSLSDFATDIVVLLGFNFVKKPADDDHKYGHAKYETLSAVIIGMLLLIVGFYIMFSGAKNILSILKGGDFDKPSLLPFIAAVVSIISKEWLYRYTINAGRKINSQAVIANAWHHRSDGFSSIGTMIGIGLALFLGEKWVVCDPIAAIIVSFFIIKVAVEIIKASSGDLLDQALSKDIEDEMISLIKGIDGVKNPHEIRTRRIGNDYSIDIHIEVDRDLPVRCAHEIATNVEDQVRKKYGEKTNIIVHIEPCERVDDVNGGI